LIFSLAQSVVLFYAFSFSLPEYFPDSPISDDPSMSRISFSPSSIFGEMGWALAIYIMAFSLLEKVNKQKYVVATTNAKTKKLTLQLINQIPNPIALVSKKGQILFFN
jgi:hypothetical protein